MTPQEMIDVIQAHADGKQIQMHPKEDPVWFDCKPPSPTFDFHRYEYRVKPAAPAMWQYYWKNAACCAVGASDANCKCWWHEGTGPAASARHDDSICMKWRPAKQPALRPHWSALIRCRGVNPPVMGDTLFATEDEARAHYTSMDVTTIRLATEYPPVMLP